MYVGHVYITFFYLHHQRNVIFFYMLSFFQLSNIASNLTSTIIDVGEIFHSFRFILISNHFKEIDT